MPPVFPPIRPEVKPLGLASDHQQDPTDLRQKRVLPTRSLKGSRSHRPARWSRRP